MKDCFHIYTLLLLFVFCISCHGQNKTEPIKKATSVNTTSLGPTSITRKIKKDKEENLLIASYEGIMRYDGNFFTNYTKEAGLDTCYAFDVLEDKIGNIWIASDVAGAYRYDGKFFTSFTTKEGLAHNRLMSVYEDKTGNIWFATQGGLSRYDGKSFRNFTTKEGLPHNDVNCFIEDRTGKFWIGTRGYACFYDGKTFTTFTNKSGLPFKNVWSIIEDKKGNIWLGGEQGLWSYNGSSFTNFTTEGVNCVYEDKKGNIWFSHGTTDPHKGGLSRYDEKSLLSEKPKATQILIGDGMFFGIAEDKEGGIWVGTLEGVFRYDGKSINYFKEIEDQK